MSNPVNQASFASQPPAIPLAQSAPTSPLENAVHRLVRHHFDLLQAQPMLNTSGVENVPPELTSEIIAAVLTKIYASLSTAATLHNIEPPALQEVHATNINNAVYQVARLHLAIISSHELVPDPLSLRESLQGIAPESLSDAQVIVCLGSVEAEMDAVANRARALQLRLAQMRNAHS